MSASEMYWGHVVSVVVAFLMLGVALRWRTGGRMAYAALFLWASQVNLRIALFRPGEYQGFADLAWSQWYRGFITGFFAEHATSIIALIATGQLLIAVLITSRGLAVRAGLAGAVLFLLAIVPLGVGSAFPATLVMAVGAAWLMRGRFGESLWRETGRRVPARALLACGIASSLVYVGNDMLNAAAYPGYRMLDQAISELSATGAPTKARWETMGLLYSALVFAFSLGVLRVARGNRMLRTTGWLLLAFALSGPVWALVPMHQRGTPANWQDVGHIVLSVASVLLIALFMGAGAFTRGTRFRIFSLAALAPMLAFGIATFSYADRIATGEPTRWMGLLERASLYLYLLWIAVLGALLLRRGVVAHEPLVTSLNGGRQAQSLFTLHGRRIV